MGDWNEGLDRVRGGKGGGEYLTWSERNNSVPSSNLSAQRWPGMPLIGAVLGISDDNDVWPRPGVKV